MLVPFLGPNGTWRGFTLAEGTTQSDLPNPPKGDLNMWASDVGLIPEIIADSTKEISDVKTLPDHIRRGFMLDKLPDADELMISDPKTTPTGQLILIAMHKTTPNSTGELHIFWRKLTMSQAQVLYDYWRSQR